MRMRCRTSALAIASSRSPSKRSTTGAAYGYFACGSSMMDHEITTLPLGDCAAIECGGNRWRYACQNTARTLSSVPTLSAGGCVLLGIVLSGGSYLPAAREVVQKDVLPGRSGTPLPALGSMHYLQPTKAHRRSRPRSVL